MADALQPRDQTATIIKSRSACPRYPPFFPLLLPPLPAPSLIPPLPDPVPPPSLSRTLSLVLFLCLFRFPFLFLPLPLLPVYNTPDLLRGRLDTMLEILFRDFLPLSTSLNRLYWKIYRIALTNFYRMRNTVLLSFY